MKVQQRDNQGVKCFAWWKQITGKHPVYVPTKKQETEVDIQQFSGMFKEPSPENTCNDAEVGFSLLDSTQYLVQPSAGVYILLALWPTYQPHTGLRASGLGK